MTSIDIGDIAGPDGDSMSFKEVGDTAKGIITHLDQSNRVSQFSGNTETVLRITLEQGDGSNVIIWPVTNTNVDGDGYPTRMARAIVAAVRKAEANTLSVGGELAVQFASEIPTDKGNPAKEFVAAYKAPAASVDANDLLGGGVEPQVEVTSQPAQPTEAPTAADLLG